MNEKKLYILFEKCRCNCHGSDLSRIIFFNAKPERYFFFFASSAKPHSDRDNKALGLP